LPTLRSSDLSAQLLGQLRVLAKVGPNAFAPLAELQIAVAEPRAGSHDDLLKHRQIEHIPLVADAVSMHHIKFGDAERRGDLVFHHLRPHTLPDHVFPFLELADTAHIDPTGAIALERPAAGGRLGTAGP